MSELNTRQWELYNYLKDQDGWRTQFSVAMDLSHLYDVKGGDIEHFHDCHARHLMTDDIRAINASDVIQKMILSSAKGIKIATEEEAIKHIKSKASAVFRQLARVRKLEKKAGLDGQLRMVFGSEREIIQSFIDSNKEGERLKSLRVKKGLTQKQAVAKMQGFIDEPMLSKIENGVCLPTSEQLSALEHAYAS